MTATLPSTSNLQADLHLHTFYSDGTFSPEEVVQRAFQLGLKAIAITDHDTVEALGPALKAAASKGLEILPGVELTVAFQNREIHILGYGIRSTDQELLQFFNRMREYRVRRIQAMIERLHLQGVTVTLEEVTSVAGKGALGRPHLAEALVKRGIVRSLEEAFQRYIGDRAPCFVKGATLTVPLAVQMIRRAGGVAVLAHPHRLVEDTQIQELVASGIQGIEVYHSDHNASIAAKYLKVCEQFGLLVTGGSDCHGLRKAGGPLMGSVTIPYALVERLKAAI